jgi:LuxR family maltose regulon positive regulatory protein
MKTNISTAKITRPKLSGTIPRQRLFKLLDGDRKKPVTWISGPAGSGKTALVASYLDARKLPCLWYSIDAGDADLASFFYYMGLAARQAAPRIRKPMPLLTPEYLPGIQNFTRRFFENLFHRLKLPFVLVFDNYHTAPSESGLPAVFAEGLSLLPNGVRCIVISRTDPPPAFARMRINGQVSLLGWEDIRFTPVETKALFNANRPKAISAEKVRLLHEKTEGWVAGLVLLLEKLKTGDADLELPDRIRQEDLFDYFAGEVFRHADTKTRDFLLKTSLPAKISLPVAEKLAAERDADAILRTLCRNNFFTTRHAAGEAVYQYHPLFRNFLLSRASAAYSADEIRALRKQAAQLLEQAGQIAGAAELYREAADWESLAGLVIKQAQRLIAEGRYQTLEAWIASVPEEMLNRSPWLLFWYGTCRLSFNPKEGQLHFGKAFNVFQQSEDTSGTLLAWSGAVNAILLGWDDFAPLDFLIAWFYARTDKLAFPTLEVEAECASSMAGALVWRQPDHPDIGEWVQRALRATRKSENVSLKLQVCINASFYYLWVGDISNALAVDGEIRQMTRQPGVSPLTLITFKWLEAGTSFLASASPESGLQAVSEALETALTNEIHLWDHMLYALGVYGSLLKGDLGEASEFLAKMKPVLRADQSHGYCLYHYMVAWYNTLLGDLSEARTHAELAVKLAVEIRGAGLYFPEFLCRNALTNVLCETKNYQAAGDQLAVADDVVRRSRSRIFDFMHRLTKARILLEQGSETQGLDELRSALELGRSHNFINMLFWWQPTVMAVLCQRALEDGIEVDYVQNLVRKRNLFPESPPLDIDNWPWPLKIVTMGRFEIIKNGRPVATSGKAQKKPLLMLKALVVSGPDGMLKDQMIDALWPESEGDVATSAFHTTLLRLRRLVADDRIIRFNEGNLSLHRRYCWVDAWAFERLCDRIAVMRNEERYNDEEDGSAAKKLTDKAIGLYKGHFLTADHEYAPAVLARERLRSKYLRLILWAGQTLERFGDFEAAMDYYARGLESEPLAEEFYQGLMTCCLRLGRKAEALTTYQRCRGVLAAKLGIEPSPKTELLKQQLTKK